MYRLIGCVVFIVLLALCTSSLSASANDATPINSTATANELLFVHVLYRHGDRTPFRPYPNDPWAKSEYWPAGWGQLTNAGKLQHYELGTWLRRRYIGTVLRERYHGDDIYIESTDFERTLMSAAINSAAMFPPAADDRWSPDGVGAIWQPIPVHTVPLKSDVRLWAGRPCAAFNHHIGEVTRHVLRHYNERYSDIMQYVRKHSGSPLADMWDILSVYDTLLVQAANNFTLPAWTHRVYPHDGPLRHATLTAYTMQSRRPALARLKFGWLLREMLERFRAKATGRLEPARRTMWVYSAHDSTISGMLNTLGLFDLHFPPYAATLLFELRRIDGAKYVQVFYRNSTIVEPQPMPIPQCGPLCPLERMFELFERVLPTGSWEEECQWPPVQITEGKQSVNHSSGGAGLAICGWFVAVGVVWELWRVLIM